MDQSKAASTLRANGDRSEISEDLRQHNETCKYYQFQEVHYKVLFSKEKVEQRLRQDLIRKRKGKTQVGVIAEVDALVAKAMSDNGVVSRYLNMKSETHAGIRTHLKSACNCEVTNIKTDGHQPRGKIEAPDDNGHSKDTVDVLRKDEELGHHKTIFVSAALENTAGPSPLQTTHSEKQNLTPNHTLKSEELDVSEDEEETKELQHITPKAPGFSILASAVANPHDELDYSEDDINEY